MGTGTRVTAKIGAVVMISALAVAAHLIAVTSPQIALGGGRADSVDVLTTDDYPVSVAFSLQPDGWIDMIFLPLTATDLARTMACTNDPNTSGGLSCATLVPDIPEGESVQVTLVAACDAQLDISTARGIPAAQVIDGSAQLEVVADSGGCGGYADLQIVALPLQVSPARPTGLRIKPLRQWSSATLDQRVARFPWISVKSDPVAGDPAGPVGSSLTLYMQVREGDSLEAVRPAPLSEDDSETLVWLPTRDAGDASAEYSPYARWSSPTARPWTQFLLVLSGVLFGVAASLVVTFVLPARLSPRAEKALEEAMKDLRRATQALVDSRDARERRTAERRGRRSSEMRDARSPEDEKPRTRRGFWWR